MTEKEIKALVRLLKKAGNTKEEILHHVSVILEQEERRDRELMLWWLSHPHIKMKVRKHGHQRNS